MTVFASLAFSLDDVPTIDASFKAPPVCTLRASTIAEVKDVLSQACHLARSGMFVIGGIAYEAARAFDSAFVTKEHDYAARCAPDMQQVHKLQTASDLEDAHNNSPPLLAVFHVFDYPPQSSGNHGRKDADGAKAWHVGTWRRDMSASDFMRRVDELRENIAAGDFYQANLTYRYAAEFSGNPYELWLALRQAQPQSLAFYLDAGDLQIASVSPELFFNWDRTSRRLMARPMKGTAAPDSMAAAEYLRESAKERAENLMIVDLLRNDMARIAEQSSVRVPHLFTLEKLPTALQMTSTITATTRQNVDVDDIFAAIFPCGSITGAPKVAAMEALAHHEVSPRGFYCGALGIISPQGATFSVGIRTVVVRDKVALCGVGGGITWDSVAASEESETLVKRRFLLRATAAFDIFTTMRLENGKIAHHERHIARMLDSARHFGFNITRHNISAALAEMCAKHNQGLWRARLALARDGKIHKLVSAFTDHVQTTPQQVALAQQPVSSDDEFLRHKTTNREAYDTREIKGFFDTLLYNERGEITEFTRGNVVAEIGGRLLTPPLSCGLLAGVMRDDMLQRGTLTEAIISIQDLARTSRLWFINSLRGMIEVSIAP